MSSRVNKKILKSKTKDYIFVYALLFVPISLWAFFFFTTNFSSIAMAFQSIDYFGNRSWIGFDNFVQFINECLSDGDVLSISLINSLKNYIICLVICNPLYIFFSYYIFKKTRGSRFVQSISMVPRIIPGMVISLVFMNFVQDALPDIFLKTFNVEMPNLFRDAKYTYGTTLFYTIWLSFATSLIVLPNAINGISQEIFESAELDGVDNIFTELWYIILPLIYPTLETLFITGFAAFLTQAGPLITFWLYNAPQETWNMGYYYYKQTFAVVNESGYPVLAAGGLIMTVIIAPLTHLLKYCLEKFGPSED